VRLSDGGNSLRKGRNRREGEGRREGGFTLLETSIALVMLMVVSLSAASLFTYAITNNGNAGDRAMATTIAQQQAEQLRSVNFGEMETLVPATAGTPKSLTTAGRTYQVTVSYAYTPSGATAATATQKSVTVTVTPSGGNGLLTTNSVRISILRSTLEMGNYTH
jgi:Tfp pilus assembly protein PilV